MGRGSLATSGRKGWTYSNSCIRLRARNLQARLVTFASTWGYQSIHLRLRSGSSLWVQHASLPKARGREACSSGGCNRSEQIWKSIVRKNNNLEFFRQLLGKYTSLVFLICFVNDKQLFRSMFRFDEFLSALLFKSWTRSASLRSPWSSFKIEMLGRRGLRMQWHKCYHFLHELIDWIIPWISYGQHATMHVTWWSSNVAMLLNTELVRKLSWSSVRYWRE